MASSESGAASATTQTHQDSTEGVDLLTDELVLENRHPAYVNWWKSLLIGAFFALTALGAATSGDIGTVMTSLVVAGVIGAYVYFSRAQSRYVVTDERVIRQVGLIRSSTGETRISDIRGITTEQGIIERIVGKGSVQIDSTAAGGLLRIDGVDDYNGLARTIRTQQQQLDSSQ